MADPWLKIIGLGEDGLAGLSSASREALAGAEIIFGGARHLDLVNAGARGQAWPLPFSTEPVLAFRGRNTVVLASGDPFWHGVGGSLMADLLPDEWVSYPVISSFQMAANRIGWRLEDATCIGLHAAPFSRLVPVVGAGKPVICTLRDGAAVADLAVWLTGAGHGGATLHVMERLGGPSERLRNCTAASCDLADVTAPVMVALTTPEAGLSQVAGLQDDMFCHDGQITKRPIRALTLSALAPRKGQHLWDLGAGSGSISVEWCLAGGIATAIEQRADRAANIRKNATRFGLDHLMTIIEGASHEALAGLTRPDTVFVGGGADAALVTALWAIIPAGTRLVMNSITLETEALLTHWHSQQGGDLMRIDLAHAAPLGRMRGWESQRPVVQWSVTR